MNMSRGIHLLIMASVNSRDRSCKESSKAWSKEQGNYKKSIGNIDAVKLVETGF